MSRYHDSQLQVTENYSDFQNYGTSFSLCTVCGHFIIFKKSEKGVINTTCTLVNLSATLSNFLKLSNFH